MGCRCVPDVCPLAASSDITGRAVRRDDRSASETFLSMRLIAVTNKETFFDEPNRSTSKHTTTRSTRMMMTLHRIQWLLSLFLIVKQSYLTLVHSAFVSPTPRRDVPRTLGSELYLKRGGTKKKRDKGNLITLNKLAYRNYEVLETLEVGIALRGTEVKRYVKLALRVFDSDSYSRTHDPSRSPFKPSPTNVPSR
ncbi:hypothetical protein HJC23_010208 [Cyclotella cryptica]|uniref:Uncharacterized protein n=1 Tax=Cyclotella cryptica TaxID=29204 RepID=A0ABD3PGM5_9STRA